MNERDSGYCPYLGLQEDPTSFFVYPTPIHRCHRSGNPIPVHPDDQESYCLSPNHVSCPRYQDPSVTMPSPPESEEEVEAVYDHYGWYVAPAQDTGWGTQLRNTAIALGAITLIVVIATLVSNQLRLARALQTESGSTAPRPPSLVLPSSSSVPLVSSGSQPTDTPTPFATWTPTATATSTATPTQEPPTATPTPTIMPTPTDTPTMTPTPIPTPTPRPQFVPRGPIRYEPSCERTAVYGFVYDAYDNGVSGQTVKLWNDFGYSSIAHTETVGQGHGEGYYEFYLYPGPYERPEQFHLAVIDPATEQPISPQLTVEFTPDRCKPGEGGRQIAIVDWVYNP